jgi:8-oxo-dGTP pyrophosphatase MutT (NUDIX family)
MSFLDHIRRCNTYAPSRFLPFEVGGRQAGWVSAEMAGRLAGLADTFVVDSRRVRLAEHLASPEQRTEAVRQAVRRLDGALGEPSGEDYAVVANWGDEPLMLMDRQIVPAFGVRAFGIHVNGIVRDGGRLKLWIGRRAADKRVAPNKLDNMIAGGQPAKLTLTENLIKEAAEEADLPASLALTARPVGALSYCFEGRGGLKPDTLFVYDLELPTDFVPRNTDGEISHFTLMDVEEVTERVRSTDDFKFNVNLVIIDFLIRHGILTAENEPDYMELVTGLRVRL